MEAQASGFTDEDMISDEEEEELDDYMGHKDREERDRVGESRRCLRLLDFFLMGGAAALATVGINSLNDMYGREAEMLTFAVAITGFILFVNSLFGCIAVSRTKTTWLMIVSEVSCLCSLA